MKLRRTLVHGSAALALLVAAGCGDDDGDSAATTTTTDSAPAERSVDDAVVERVSDAVGATVDEGTAAMTVTVETAGTGVGDGRQPVEVDGEVDFEAEQRLLTIEGPEGELQVVIDGQDAYVELPATEGDDWMQIELDSLLDEDIGFGGPAAIPFQDPAENLRVLEASAVHAQEVGEEQIDGEDTTHYELVIDLQAAAEDTSTEVQDAVDTAAERTGMDELEMEVWVDDDDLIRRVAYTVDLSQAEVSEDDEAGAVEADPEGRITVTVDYRDFGTTVDIEVPSEDQVIELDEDAVRDAIGGTSDSGDGTTSTTSGDDDGDDEDDTTTTSSTTTSSTTTTTSG